MQRRPATFTILMIVLVTAATAALGALVSGGDSDPWYAALNKSPLTPPGPVFGSVWPILYCLMALGAVLVRIKAGSFAAASRPLGIYFTQLTVNLSWSWLFFGFQQVLLALIAIGVLLVLILAMIRSFARISIAAGLLQIPYLLWLGFATYLNASVLALN